MKDKIINSEEFIEVKQRLDIFVDRLKNNYEDKSANAWNYFRYELIPKIAEPAAKRYFLKNNEGLVSRIMGVVLPVTLLPECTTFCIEVAKYAESKRSIFKDKGYLTSIRIIGHI